MSSGERKSLSVRWLALLWLDFLLAVAVVLAHPDQVSMLSWKAWAFLAIGVVAAVGQICEAYRYGRARRQGAP